MTVLEERFMAQVPGTLREIAEALKTISKKMGDEPKAEKPANSVWVFVADQTYDCVSEDILVEVFATKEAAIKYLHQFVREEGDESSVDYAKKNGWVIEHDEPDLFRAYRDGCYATDHIECQVHECRFNN